MSKEIFLYSEDKKYKCAFDLAETTDHFGCPDHSAMVLFEERKNGTYIIAQARDKILVTAKDQRIAELEEQLKNAIVPKFKYHQVVYVLCNTDIIKGQIDCFDYYNKKYLIWTMEFGLGNEWCYEHELFTTKEEAEAKLKELQGE